MKNKGLSLGLIAVIIVVVVLVVTGFSQYNSIVTMDEKVNTGWANVENQYQRRLDLIPNLVASVKGYAQHEQSTYVGLAEARSGLQKAYENAESVNSEIANVDEASLRQFQQAQEKLQSALGIYVNAVHEAYPELKADKTFLDLMTQLEGTENRIAAERTRYNELVNDYNIKVRRFPGAIFAGIFGFSTRAQFRAEAGAESAPKVEF
ncbi:MAG: LemA family protein [Muribaculaceae bacterium]|nr:LemA family protein [Muribaculaceae bacterium]